MAKIPDAQTLGVRTPSPTRQIASYDGSAGAKGMIAAGQQIQKFGAEAQVEVDKAAAKQSRLESANVMLQAMQNDTAYEEELRKNPGAYANAADGYDKLYNDSAPKLLEQVSDPEQRKLTEIALREQQIRGRQRITTLARGYESDATKAYLTDSFAEARQGVRNLDDAARLLTVRKAQYDGYAAKGVIGADDAARMFQAERKEAQSTIINGRMATGDYRALWKDLTDAPLNVRNNNPGNIRGADGQFRKFDTPEAGMAEMERDLGVKVSGNSSAMKANFGAGYTPSIRNIIATWAPKSENDTNAYVASVAKDSGLDPDAPLSKDDIKKIMPAMIKVEGGSNSMSYYTQIDPDIRDTALRQLKPIIQSDVRQKVENTVAAAGDGLVVDPVPDSDLLMLDDPNAVANYKNAIDTAQQSYQFMNMPQAKIMEQVSAAKPVDAASPNYAVQSKQYEVLQQAAVKAVKQQIEAPIETAMKVDPAIRELAEKAAADPKMYPAYFAALDGKYKEWGVTPKYRYMSKTQSDAIAADIEGAMTKGGDVAAAKMKAYYDIWGGDKFGAIMGDIAPALSGPARVAASIYDNANPAASREILNIAAVKTDDLSAQLLPIQAKEIRDSITSALAPMQQTLLNTNPGSGASTFTDIREQATRLAYSYAAKGMSASEAAKLAAKAVALDKYTFTDSYRIPVTYGDRINDIESGSRFVVNTLSVDNMHIPTPYKKAPDQYVNAVKNSARWINNPDETGLILVDDYGTPVFDKSGVAIQKSFEQLELDGINVTKSAKEIQGDVSPYMMIGP